MPGQPRPRTAALPSGGATDPRPTTPHEAVLHVEHPAGLGADPALLRRLRDETRPLLEARVSGVRLRLDDPVGLFLWRLILDAAGPPCTADPAPATRPPAGAR